MYCLSSKGDSYNSFKNGDSLIHLKRVKDIDMNNAEKLLFLPDVSWIRMTLGDR
jgi:hypothetical protein